MTLKDIIELAKQGYTPADIKELLSINIEGNSQELPQGETDAGEDHESDDATLTPNPTAEVTEADVNSVDYKKLYEDSLIKLAEAQKANISTPQPQKENDLDILADTIKGFM